MQKKILKLYCSFFALAAFGLMFAFGLFSYSKADTVSKVKGVQSTQEIYLDASTNARGHSNMGNIYFQEKNYVAAVKEYEIAYNLAPDSRLASTYLYNIARCYMILGRYDLAKNALSGAIKKDYMNITYYNAYADCVVANKSANAEIKKLSTDDKNPYNKIVVGLIYLKQGKIRNAKTIFDDFVAKNPKNMMSEDIRTILNNL